MIAHRRESAEVLSQGISLTLDGQETWVQAQAAMAEELREPFDLILLFTKTMASRSALDSVRHLLPAGGETVLLSLQNGLGNAELLSEYVDADHRMVGVMNFPCDLVRTGTVVLSSTG